MTERKNMYFLERKILKNLELSKVFRLDITLCLPERDQSLMKPEIQLFVSFGLDLGSKPTSSIR